jgi:hypothetical protein
LDRLFNHLGSTRKHRRRHVEAGRIFKYLCAAVEVSDSDQTPAISIAQAPFITASAAPVVWPRSGHFISAIPRPIWGISGAVARPAGRDFQNGPRVLAIHRAVTNARKRP